MVNKDIRHRSDSFPWGSHTHTTRSTSFQFHAKRRCYCAKSKPTNSPTPQPYLASFFRRLQCNEFKRHLKLRGRQRPTEAPNNYLTSTSRSPAHRGARVVNLSDRQKVIVHVVAKAKQQGPQQGIPAALLRFCVQHAVFPLLQSLLSYTLLNFETQTLHQQLSSLRQKRSPLF